MNKTSSGKRLRTLVIAGVSVFLVAASGPALAQGFNGLSQLLGGGGSNPSQSQGGFGGLSQLLGGGAAHSRNSTNQPIAAVTVQRSAAPYIGRFTSNQDKVSGKTLTAEFVCYPAHDTALPQSKAFVCYETE